MTLQVIAYLNYEELTKRVQECQDPIEKRRWQAIQLLSQSDVPMTTQQVATTLSYSPDWVRKQVRRYNRLGVEGLVNGQHRQQQRGKRYRMERNCLLPLHRS